MPGSVLTGLRGSACRLGRAGRVRRFLRRHPDRRHDRGLRHRRRPRALGGGTPVRDDHRGHHRRRFSPRARRPGQAAAWPAGRGRAHASRTRLCDRRPDGEDRNAVGSRHPGPDRGRLDDPWDGASHEHPADDSGEAAEHDHDQDEGSEAALPAPKDPPIADRRLGPPGSIRPGVPAIIVKAKSIADAYRLRSEYRTQATLGVFPAEVLTRLFATLGDIRRILGAIAFATQGTGRRGDRPRVDRPSFAEAAPARHAAGPGRPTGDDRRAGMGRN